MSGLKEEYNRKLTQRFWKRLCTWSRHPCFIAETLLESLGFEEDFAVSPAWRDEIARRCEQIDRGEVELVDSDNVMAELRKKHA